MGQGVLADAPETEVAVVSMKVREVSVVVADVGASLPSPTWLWLLQKLKLELELKLVREVRPRPHWQTLVFLLPSLTPSQPCCRLGWCRGRGNGGGSHQGSPPLAWYRCVCGW